MTDSTTTAIIWHRSLGDFYRVDYPRQTLTLFDNLANSPNVLSSTPGGPAQSALWQLACTCISKQFGGLNLNSESTHQFEGQKFLTEIIINNINLGEVPAPSWFELPPDFKQTKAARTPVN